MQGTEPKQEEETERLESNKQTKKENGSGYECINSTKA